MPATALYAALLALLFVALGVRTVRLRGRLHGSLGDGNQPALRLLWVWMGSALA